MLLKIQEVEVDDATGVEEEVENPVRLWNVINVAK